MSQPSGGRLNGRRNGETAREARGRAKRATSTRASMSDFSSTIDDKTWTVGWEGLGGLPGAVGAAQIAARVLILGLKQRETASAWQMGRDDRWTRGSAMDNDNMQGRWHAHASRTASQRDAPPPVVASSARSIAPSVDAACSGAPSRRSSSYRSSGSFASPTTTPKHGSTTSCAARPDQCARTTACSPGDA